RSTPDKKPKRSTGLCLAVSARYGGSDSHNSDRLRPVQRYVRLPTSRSLPLHSTIAYLPHLHRRRIFSAARTPSEGARLYRIRALAGRHERSRPLDRLGSICKLKLEKGDSNDQESSDISARFSYLVPIC